ncbi:MAG: SRPBCC domain-containing protein [Sphingobacteriales bacterium]|nr:MAG: SRPBCC domain-containing protein [Sphingobacteriales bacterium]
MFNLKCRFMKEVIDEVHITKTFAVAKAELYNAWIEEAQLKQWWQPMNKSLLSVESDIQEGGRISYQFENDLAITGQYKEVQPEGKLVYSWNWTLPHDASHDGEYLLTILFRGDDAHSELEVRQEDFKNIQAVKPHHEGWEKALEDLKQYLEAKNKD